RTVLRWQRRSVSALVVGVFSVTALLAAVSGIGGGATAGATTGGNFVATGHDMDLHCAGGQTPECDYLKIVLDKVRNGSTLPILALDEGTELPTALAALTGEPSVTTV